MNRGIVLVAPVVLAGLVTTACSGGRMLEQKKSAPALSSRDDGAVTTIDGRKISLEQLTRQGPVMVVFLRGFS